MHGALEDGTALYHGAVRWYYHRYLSPIHHRMQCGMRLAMLERRVNTRLAVASEDQVAETFRNPQHSVRGWAIGDLGFQ